MNDKKFDLDLDDMEVLKKDEQVIIFQNVDRKKILKVLEKYEKEDELEFIKKNDTSIRLTSELVFKVVQPQYKKQTLIEAKKKNWDIKNSIDLDSGCWLLIYKKEK